MSQPVDLGDLLPGVSDDEIAVGSSDREFLLPFDVAGMDHNLATAHQIVEHLSWLLATPHPHDNSA